jgi:hypothetical protein
MTILKDLEEQDKKLTREEHIINYIKSLDMIEQAIEPYREHKLALKKNYDENKWLSRKEQSDLLRAYRMVKKEEDPQDIQDFFDLIKAKIKI